MITLKHDTAIRYMGADIIVPAGAKVHEVSGRWVVSSIQLLIALTGNDHDPKYRYAWLPEGVEVSNV